MAAAATDVIIPALQEARGAEAAVADRLRAQTTATRDGDDLETMQRHLVDARGHMRRIDERLARLQPSKPLYARFGHALSLTGQAALLPLEVAVGIPTTVLRGKATGQQMLKNAKENCAAAAYAVAACRAGEAIAHEAGDEVSARLLGDIRRDDEALLDDLGRGLEQRAEAVAAATLVIPAGRTGVVGAVRGRAEQVLGTGERWWRQTQQAAERARGTWEGAMVSEDELPIPDYGQLAAHQVIELLPRLSQEDLTVVEAYERAHAGRVTILHRAAELRGNVPWPGYDSMHADEIRQRLRGAEAGLARHALDYERHHRRRSTVMEAAAAHADT
ncbi:hypothetical protein NGB36_02990 [Streptomyces sp. RB6PN25]|uniref:HNH endonuclease n=1 Tax=Streptomyces humicola TaxID=2953240 RepID=A0ABT1PPI3_9ACTN|nr:hypothetical protein [Streptomyces humicola]MCQ4079593.1 hypothetical protein [Streptomyces humicola]